MFWNSAALELRKTIHVNKDEVRVKQGRVD